MQTEIQHRDIYSITRLNREVRSILDTGFPLLWLEGELSNLACPASGHWYFSLKDSHAQVRGAMFKTRNRLLRFVPRNGMQVIVRAKIGLYEPRGEFQIIIEHMEEAGEGALRQQFEELKNKLNNEGLFASQIKKQLPPVPKCVGIITSPTGAAIHDVLTTLKRRFASLNVVIYPVTVQGNPAAADISKTILLANKRRECDVLILTRGGGSLEDLWSFNEETVARALYDSTIPIISAVGHDVDFTISDFVADVRAATPTAAAELVSPDTEHWLQQINALQKRLRLKILNILQSKQTAVTQSVRNLVHPSKTIEDTHQRIDEILYRLTNSMQSHLSASHLKLNHVVSRSNAINPTQKIDHYQQKFITLKQRLIHSQQQQINNLKQRFIKSTSTLEAVSPLATLNRGYAYVKLAKNGNIVSDSKQLKKGDEVYTTLAKGNFTATISNIRKK